MVNARFETFLLKNCHEAFSERELLQHFSTGFDTFRHNLLPEHLESYEWEAELKLAVQVPRLPSGVRFGRNLPSDPIRYHEVAPGIHLRIEQKFAGRPRLHEEYTFYFADKKTVFQFRVPFYDATLRKEHPFLFVRCAGFYFYLQPDFSNLADVLASMENKKNSAEAEREAMRSRERGKREKEGIENSDGSFRY